MPWAEPLGKTGRPRGGGGRRTRGSRGGRADVLSAHDPSSTHLGLGARGLGQRQRWGCLGGRNCATLRRRPRSPLPESPVPAASGTARDSDSEGADAEPGGAPRVLVRRRRLLLDPGEAPAVPVYSEKVKSSLHLIPDNVSLLKLCPPEAEEEADVEDAQQSSWVVFPSQFPLEEEAEE